MLGLAGLVLLLLTAGCAVLGRGDDPFRERDPDREGPITLEVQNDHFNDARIYALFNGDRRRVGLVVGNTTARFELEARGPDLRVEVDLVAGRGFTTGRLAVWPGDTVRVDIPSNLSGAPPVIRPPQGDLPLS